MIFVCFRSAKSGKEELTLKLKRIINFKIAQDWNSVLPPYDCTTVQQKESRCPRLTSRAISGVHSYEDES